VRYAWIDKHRRTYSTTMMCELLSVSRSGFNAARVRAPSKRSLEDEQLLRQIRHAQQKHRGRYGRRRMTAEELAKTPVAANLRDGALVCDVSRPFNLASSA